jgi:hypothetical protein
MAAPTRRKPDDGWRDPLWERQPGETDKAFNGFATFRDLGPARSLADAGRALGVSKVACEQWSVKWGWVERAGSWDDEADRNQRERDLIERQEIRAKMLAGHARGGAALHEIGLRALDRFDTSNPESADEARARIEALTPLQAARLMEVGARLERVARDDPNRRVTDPEALQFVEALVDLTLAHLAPEQHLAFLADMEAKFGVGQGL